MKPEIIQPPATPPLPQTPAAPPPPPVFASSPTGSKPQQKSATPSFLSGAALPAQGQKGQKQLTGQ